MSELSIFIDESGDFGDYEHHCPFYIITLIFHDQSKNINREVMELKRHIINCGFPSNHAVHSAPLIRREGVYSKSDWKTRRKLFRYLFDFLRFANISYKAFVFKRKKYSSAEALISRMSKETASFIRDNLEWFNTFDRIVVYYDNGQNEISRLINIVMSTMLDIEVRKALPSDYCLLQAADLICTLELAQAKIDEKNYHLSASEIEFFSGQNRLRKNYLKPLLKKRFC